MKKASSPAQYRRLRSVGARAAASAVGAIADPNGGSLPSPAVRISAGERTGAHSETGESVALTFQNATDLPLVEKPLHRDLSAVAIVGRTLFCAADEAATVERLVYDDGARAFGSHRNVALGDFFHLPGGADGEMDIEGLAVEGGYLWVTGSHGLRRKKDKQPDGHRRPLPESAWQPNRSFLGRVPLRHLGGGVYGLAGQPGPCEKDRGLRPAAVRMRGRKARTVIGKMLAADPLLAPFMNVPCKENGFDIEGIAVAGDRVLIGLRGPVLAGRAMLVEMRLVETRRGHLKPARIEGRRRYRLHALPLDGLGIRDLRFRGDMLHILAGPTMALDGDQAVYVLDGAGGRRLPAAANPKRVLDLPARRRSDRAEGIAFWEWRGKCRLLVVYDSPSPQRTEDAASRVTADLFPAPWLI